MHDRLPDATKAEPASSTWLWALAGICALAFVLRLGAALALPSIERPDELFQNLEPAYRIWTGHGIVTWEWRAGIRSPIFPGALAGLMEAAAFLGAGPGGCLAAISAAMSALSTAVVALAFCAGRRHAGLPGALTCGLLCAIWPDLVYFGSKPLAEVQGGNLLAIAALIVVASTQGRKPRSGILPAIGVLLGLAFCLRFQLAPAIALVAAWAIWPDPWRRSASVLAGACIPLLAMGAIDWLGWGVPFHSVLANVEINVLQHAAAGYGTEPFPWYGAELAFRWGAALVPIAVAAWAGLEAAPILGWVVLLVVLPHSLIGHKEISFVQAAMAPTLVLAALGTCRLAAAAKLPPAAALAAWAAIALATACSAGFAPLWTRDRAELRAAAFLRQQQGLCGLGIRWPIKWYWVGSQALLGRPVPIYAFGSDAGIRRVAPAIDAAIGGPDVATGLPGFSIEHCWPNRDGQHVCLARTPRTTCTPDPRFGLNAVADLGRPGTQRGADQPDPVPAGLPGEP